MIFVDIFPLTLHRMCLLLIDCKVLIKLLCYKWRKLVMDESLSNDVYLQYTKLVIHMTLKQC
ncbi:hypothetical protein O6H91_02G153500 [Diphasiastrum complanatum]|uniref:Uncharacterized protein n=1 Tax=Diphasiastrum complanatum TaxID=34168 RepID=A0ACC2EME2_DIPCM|nr:hypothetical protein O6H91_02G153500 [Diphasiastrum complanatum]